DYVDKLPEWLQMRHAVLGEVAVKNEGKTYLPMPEGFSFRDDGGTKLYDDYKFRASFPEIVAPCVRGMNGIIHRTEIQIELPDALMGMWEKATKDGMTLEAVARRISKELLTTGRFAILTDMPENPGPSDIPFLALYDAEALINWDEKHQDFFVVNETFLDRDGYTWWIHKQFRELRMDQEFDEQGEKVGDANYTVILHTSASNVVAWARVRRERRRQSLKSHTKKADHAGAGQGSAATAIHQQDPVRPLAFPSQSAHATS